MGFKQLKQFNLALLAKQGWRLQTDPNSLLYQVLKAKFFPMCDFVQATIDTNPSYTWWSVMAAQPLIRDGMRWRVGNGTNIWILGDKWLPTASTHKVISPQHFMHLDRVSELINFETASWKSVVLDVLFLPHEAEAIKSIPLSSWLPNDKLIWAASLNGLFSVRSAYQLAVKHFYPTNYGASSNNS